MDRAAKQRYLREEILENGYDPSAFAEYCERQQCTDLDDWSFEQIQSCVHEFRKLTQPGIYYLDCQKAVETQLSLEENIMVLIEDPQVTGAGYFSYGTPSFTLHTKPIGWSVNRQIDDFLWLKQTLSSMYPGIYIPPFLSKKAKKQIDNYSLLKQLIHLQKFINNIIKNPLLKTCPYLQSFLNETDAANFKKIKKEGSKYRRPSKHLDYLSLKGRLVCDGIERKQEDKLISNYLQKAEAHWAKLKSLSATLICKTKETSMVLYEVGRTLEQLEETQSLLSEFMPSSVPMYDSLKVLFGKWADFELETANLVSDYFYGLFKYSSKEPAPFKEMIKEKELKLSYYVKTNTKLMMKKERLWESEDVSKWGITENVSVTHLFNNKEVALAKMLPIETAETDAYKNEYSYLNYQIKAEIRRLLLQNSKEELVHFADFSKTFSEHLTKLHLHLGDLLASLTQIRAEEQNK